MPTLEELLRDALKCTNSKFEGARRDLNAAALELKKSVETVTNNKATAYLISFDEDEEGARYELAVNQARSQSDPRELACFFVPSTGYPIQRMGSNRALEEIFRTNDELRAFFQKLATGDSPLVAYLAFLLRTSDRQATKSDSEAPVPF